MYFNYRTSFRFLIQVKKSCMRRPCFFGKLNKINILASHSSEYRRSQVYSFDSGKRNDSNRSTYRVANGSTTIMIACNLRYLCTLKLSKGLPSWYTPFWLHSAFESIDNLYRETFVCCYLSGLYQALIFATFFFGSSCI